MRLIGSILAIAAALTLLPPAAQAGDAWESIRGELYGARVVAPAGERLTLETPYRAADDRAVPITASVALPAGETIRALSLIIDENPMPVSAVFDMAAERASLDVTVTMRLNGPSPVRALVETTDGRLFMAEAMVKTSGLGACAAPPVNDPAIALETLGQMALSEAVPTLDLATRALTADQVPPRMAHLEIMHPSHSGMQMNQITLLYLPAHYVETVEVWEGRHPLFSMTGSISLSENPEIDFSVAPGTSTVRVRMTDTEGGVFEQNFALGQS